LTCPAIRKSGWREQEERYQEIYPKSPSSGKKIDMLTGLKIRVQGVMISLDE
jgi:hypothetical protein